MVNNGLAFICPTEDDISPPPDPEPSQPPTPFCTERKPEPIVDVEPGPATMNEPEEWTERPTQFVLVGVQVE